MEINNPIYLPGDYDDDPEPEADERQPLGDTYQFEQDKVGLGVKSSNPAVVFWIFVTLTSLMV